MSEAKQQVEMLDIDSVEAHPDNARKGDVTAIAESLVRFGQTKPIIVQASTRYVLAGNHTREAAKSLGWPKIAAIVLDLEDEEALAYLLGDNRTSDRASYDQAQLYANLEGLLDLDGTGYDLDYVETLGDALGGTTVEGTNTGEVTKVAPPDSKPKVNSDRKKQVEAGEPMRDVVLLMTKSEADTFGQQVGALQKAGNTRTVVITVQRAVAFAAAHAEQYAAESAGA